MIGSICGHGHDTVCDECGPAQGPMCLPRGGGGVTPPPVPPDWERSAVPGGFLDRKKPPHECQTPSIREHELTTGDRFWCATCGTWWKVTNAPPVGPSWHRFAP